MADCPKCKKEIKETVSEPSHYSFNKDGEVITKWRVSVTHKCDCGDRIFPREVPAPKRD